MDNLSVIFIGTGEFGVPILEAMTKANIRIPFVVTGTDKLAGRGLKQIASPIKQVALMNKLIVHQPARIVEVKQKLIQEKPDFLLVVSYGEIIKKDILEIPRFGSINIHASLLPKYRGASPIQETILEGDLETGITWILMDEKMDEGDIIAQRNLPIDPMDTNVTLSEKLAQLAAEVTPRILIDFAKTHLSIPQDNMSASFCRKISKEDGRIDFSHETAEEIVRKVKAYNPWPGAFFILNGKRIKIIQASVDEQKIGSGEITIVDRKILAVGTQKGTILIAKLQPESKREMTAEEFLRGQKEIPKRVG
ncbi:methionyl-tRNA formyltransferase [Candidatus Peregrinibacteria bacterium]|nr:methionyl-tRNA formyltransferase [Candidatus Peregrinibacteria bacterium]